jgi:hypothetical protein
VSLIDFLLIAAGVYALFQIEHRLEDIRSELENIGAGLEEDEIDTYAVGFTADVVEKETE